MKASKVGTRPTLISAAGIAHRLGIRRQTVTNWVNRDVLPTGLDPDWEDIGVDKAGETVLRPVWPVEKLPAIKAWFESNGDGGASHAYQAGLTAQKARERRLAKALEE